MQGFDLVDTLVKINYKVYNTQQLLGNIDNAKVIYKPTGRFVIVTAQENSSEVHRSISQMVKRNFPNCAGIHFVAGSQAEVIKAKAESIVRNNLTDFTDNNLSLIHI
jgi:hypothetical protein